jgi:hypothetical protein
VFSFWNPSQEEINSLSGARLPYVSLELTSETDPAHSVKTFGLLDSGSSLSLIDSALLASNEVFYQPETAQTDVISFSGNKIRTVGTCKFSVDFVMASQFLLNLRFSQETAILTS